MINTRTTTGALALLVLSSTVASAQWVNDSTMHQVVADGSGEQVQPKISPTADGGCYISWFSSDSGYDVRLQRLDSAGNEMWAHNGILIADRGFSSTQDYGLDTDSNDNAVIAFRDDRFGGVVITAQSIAPDGTPNWGASGVQLGNSADSINSPDIAATDDGNAVVGWNNNLDTNLSQIDEMGSVVWNSTISDPGGDTIIVSAMEGSDNGSVIVSWVQYAFFLGPKHLYAQKIASDGTEAWMDRAAVYDGGSLQFGYFPEFSSDGMGGAVFSWYDTANSLNVYAQHLGSDGSEHFGHNGAAASTGPRERVAPSAAYDATNDSVFVSWIELDNNQGDQGIYTQMLDSTGTRMWTDNGKELVAPSSTGSGTVNVQAINGLSITLWIESSGFALDQVLAHGVDSMGNDAWMGGSVPVASDLNQRSRLTTAVSTDGFVIAGWQIGDFGVADIQTHNINPDGSLGATEMSCLADINNDTYIDFLDISLFLNGYANMLPSVDFNNDNNWDFLDISLFLASYSEGCP